MFSTGPLPKVPRVLEQCGGDSGPSPTPWERWPDQVCVNAAVSAEFSLAMDMASLTTGNIAVQECEDDACKSVGEGPKGLPALPAEVRLKVPKLPWEALQQVVAFFREYVKTEAMVQFFWHPTKGYLAYIPPQVVSGGGIHH